MRAGELPWLWARLTSVPGIVGTQQPHANEHYRSFLRVPAFLLPYHCQVSLKRGFSFVNKASLFFPWAFQEKKKKKKRKERGLSAP